jgi:hypothetical protein
MNAPKTPCRYCGEKFSPAGITNHETYCDGNPHVGVSPAQQNELGLSEGGEEPDTGTDPHQEADADAGLLPPRDTLTPDNKDTPKVRADGSTEEASVECPVCGSDDTMASRDARRDYEREETNPLAGVVLAFNLSERYCQDCYQLWGDEFPEPVPLDEAVGAVGGGS